MQANKKRKNKAKSVANRRKLSASLEDYLEAIYLCVRRYGVARVSQISKTLGVGKSSVTAALKTLAEEDYINYDPYQFITLTSSGEIAACNIVRKHHILKEFLTEILGIDEEQANSNACQMEHVMDDEVLDRMLCFIQYINNSKGKGKRFPELLNEFCAHNKAKKSCKGNFNDRHK